MPDRQPDKRTVITKCLIRDALKKNLDQKPLYEITVSQLCDDASINRSTFYRHYESINELYNEMISDITLDISKRTSANSGQINSISLLSGLFEFAGENIDTVSVLLKHESRDIISIIEGITKKIIEKSGNPDLKGYHCDFIAAGILNILKRWINNPDRESSTEIAIITNAIISQGLKNILNILPKQ